MPIIHTTSQLVSPAGRISLDPYDAQGLLTGQIEFGHVPSATVSIEQDKNEEYSGESASRELIGTLYGRINRTMQIVCRNLSMDNYKRFLSATGSVKVQSATPVVDELRDVLPGRNYQLGQTAANPFGVRGVSSVSVKSEVGSTVYVAGVDYNVDLAAGIIQILEGGAIAAGKVKFGYTPVAGSYTQLETGANASFRAAIVVRADNASGVNNDWYMPLCEISASGDLPLVSNELDYVEITFSVAILKPANGQAIYVGGRPVA